MYQKHVLSCAANKSNAAHKSKERGFVFPARSNSQFVATFFETRLESIFFGSLWNATVRPVDEERVSVEEFRDYAECISIVKCQNLKRVSFGLILLKKWQENSAWLSGTKNRIWEKLFR